MENPRGFASDNNAGVHPLIMDAINKVNTGHTIGYGDDKYTSGAIKKFREIFGDEARLFFVFNGTAANVLGITASTRSWNSVICAETSHMQEDECGAPEKYTGCKLLPLHTTDGKINVNDIHSQMYGIGFEHHSQPKIVSLTQSTELGTVYTANEIKEIADYAHNNNMLVHMDGARIANAAVHLGLEFREFTIDAGIDILSFGGTKNGMMYGEAVIFFEPGLAENFKYIRKQGMQLASKMRFISAQFETYLTDGLWHKNAKHANDMAQLLATEVEKIPGVAITQKVESNGIFARVPKEIIPELRQEYFFYIWDEENSEVRWMTSFDTTKEDILGFTSLLRKLL
ncbi:MAG: low specificity L-threonine aldolase [Bacteroidetes bacterium]|nr:low specificity L-threonine aldolase [Bacteroidota bacterium]